MSACDPKQAKLSEGAKNLATQLTAESTALAAELKKKSEEIDPHLNTGGAGAAINLDFDVKWSRVDFSLDLPEIKMVDQKWSLDLPQVTMKEQALIFSTPSIRMKTVKTGEYPETVCKMVTKDLGFGIKTDIPECSVKFSPIYIDIPEPFMQEQRVVMGIPEFKMGRTEFVIGVPEFTMKTQHFALDLPQFTLKKISVEAEKAKKRGDDLTQEAKMKAAKLKETFKENAKVSLGTDVTALFDCYQSELMQRKNEAMKQFEDGVNLLQATLTAMMSNKVPDTNTTLISVKKSLTEIIAKRDEFAKMIQEQFVKLGKQQQGFFEKMVGGA